MGRRRPNTGSIFYRASRKVWVAQIEHDGRLIQRSAKTRKDAEDLLDQLRKASTRVGRVPDASLTVGTFITQWLDDRGDISTSTRSTYDAHIKKRVVPSIGHIKLTKLRATDILSLWRFMRAKDFANGTMSGTAAMVRMALNDAVRWGLIDHNPAAMVKPPVNADPVWNKKPKPVILTPGQLLQLLRVCFAERHGPLVGLVATTGLRIGEALALGWSDYDGATLRVWQSVHREQGVVSAIGKMKTERSMRVLPVPAVTTELLALQKRYVEEDARLAGKRWHDLGLMFPGINGQVRHPPNSIEQLEHVLAAAKLPRLTWHSLRHTLASIMAAEGVSLMAISRTLGHTRISTTVDVYGTTAPGLLEQVTSRVDSLLPAPEH